MQDRSADQITFIALRHHRIEYRFHEPEKLRAIESEGIAGAAFDQRFELGFIEPGAKKKVTIIFKRTFVPFLKTALPVFGRNVFNLHAANPYSRRTVGCKTKLTLPHIR